MNSYIKKYAQELEPVYDDINQREQIIIWMMEMITGKKSAQLIASHYSITLEQEEQLQQWLFEHVHNHKPLQYLLGSVPFADCTIVVEPPILIPRSETEEWICNLIEQLKKVPGKKITILDLCTGTGALALALAKALPEATLYATDISEHALFLARKNAVLNAISNVIFIKSDLFDTMPPITFDLIVSNPPYLSEKEWQELDPMVKSWEDYQALVAPNDGYQLIEKIIEQAPSWLQKNPEFDHNDLGQLYLEIGHQQGQRVYSFMIDFFSQVKIIKDYAGKDRVLMGKL